MFSLQWSLQCPSHPSARFGEWKRSVSATLSILAVLDSGWDMEDLSVCFKSRGFFSLLAFQGVNRSVNCYGLEPKSFWVTLVTDEASVGGCPLSKCLVSNEKSFTWGLHRMYALNCNEPFRNSLFWSRCMDWKTHFIHNHIFARISLFISFVIKPLLF